MHGVGEGSLYPWHRTMRGARMLGDRRGQQGVALLCGQLSHNCHTTPHHPTTPRQALMPDLAYPCATMQSSVATLHTSGAANRVT